MTDLISQLSDVVKRAEMLDKRLACPRPKTNLRRCGRCRACLLRTALSSLPPDWKERLEGLLEALVEVRAVASGTKEGMGDMLPETAYAMFDHIEGIARSALSSLKGEEDV